VNIKTASGDIRLHWLPASAVPVAIPVPAPATAVPDVPEPPNRPEPSNHQPAESSDHHADESSARDARGEILEALARGEITIEEAEALLTQLEASSPND
jgi:alkylhydroperoxidase family enzyme